MNVSKLKILLKWFRPIRKRSHLAAVLAYALSLSILISSQPIMLWAQSVPPGRLTSLIEFETPAGAEAFDKLKDYQALEDALIAKDISKIPQEILDPNLLHGQELQLPNGQVFKLDDPSLATPTVVFEKLNFTIVDNELQIEARSDGHTVAIQKIKNLNPASVVADKEMAIVVGSDGDIYALDIGLIIKIGFKSSVPVFKVFDSTEEFGLAVVPSQVQSTFRTRGLKPFTLNEIETPMTNGLRPVVARDEQGDLLLSAGDLVVFNQYNDRRELLGNFRRDVLYSIMRQGIVSFAVLSVLASQNGYQDTFTDNFERQLMIDGMMPLGTKTLMENVLELIEDQEQKNQIDQLQAKISESDPLTLGLLQSFNRDEIKALVQRALGAKNQEVTSASTNSSDQFTMTQWFASYEKISKQLIEERAVLDYRLESANTSLKAQLEERKKILDQAEESSDARLVYKDLATDYVRGESQFAAGQKSWYQKINWKTVKKVSWMTSAAGLTAWAGTSGFSALFPMEFGLTLNWMNQHLVPEVLKGTYKGVPYWKPALYGGLSLLALAPAINVMSWASVPFMQWMSRASQTLTRISPKPIADRLKRVSASLKKTADTFRPLTNWQRIVTAFTRPYAYFVLPLFNWVDSYFIGGAIAAVTGTKIPDHRKQNIVAAMRQGLFPLQKIKANSNIGEQLGLENDESIRVGVSNPFVKKETAIRNRELQNKAINLIELERNKAKILAWTLATLVVSKDSDIDPATLLAIQSGQITSDQLININKDKKAAQTWTMLATFLTDEFMTMSKNDKSLSLSNVKEEDIEKFYNLALTTAKQINKNGKIRNAIKKLSLSFKNLGRSAMMGTAEFGREEFEFLRSVTASEFVAKQTAQGFIYDHGFVVGLPIAWGARADLNNPSALAHDPSVGWKHLWTTDQHMNDVFQNFMVHLLMAGPKKTLLYQKMKPQSEDNYKPIENTLIQATQRTEHFMTAATNWVGSLFKRLPDLNLGSYYIYGFKRQLFTIQAGLLLTVMSRLAITDQSMGNILFAYLFMFVAGTLTYGWPWTLLERGNQFEEERLGETRDKLNNLLATMANQLRRGEKAAYTASSQELMQMYSDSKGPGFKRLMDQLTAAEKMMKLRRSERSKNKDIAKAIKDVQRQLPLMRAIAKLNEAYTLNDTEALASAHAEFEVALSAAAETPEFQALQKSLEDDARILVDYSIENPPAYNHPNPATSNIATLGLGAAFTTYLAVGLLVDSFSPEKLNAANVGLWAAKTGIFFSTMYFMFSKYMWKNTYIPLWESKVLPALKKAGLVKDKKDCNELLE